MPTVNFRGKIYNIPFDAARIADLMSRGYEVSADEGTDEETIQAHRGMLKPELEKLWWGKQQFKTAPGQRENREIPGDPFEFQNVVPSPLNSYKMPLFDSNELTGMQLDPQRKNKPTVL